MKMVREKVEKRGELPARVKRGDCIDKLEADICQNAKDKNMCSFGEFGGFGAMIRNNCMATCQKC